MAVALALSGLKYCYSQLTSRTKAGSRLKQALCTGALWRRHSEIQSCQHLGLPLLCQKMWCVCRDLAGYLACRSKVMRAIHMLCSNIACV